ncbi:MAG: hypothetical protein RXO32_10885 [Thermoproteus sp.]
MLSICGKPDVSILREGLAYAAWLSIHGSEERQRLAAEFVGYILERAREEGGAVYEKAEEVVGEGRAVGSLRLADVRGAEVEVGGKRHVVTVLGGGAQPERSWSGRTLLRIKITAEVDGVRRDYTMTYGRYGKNNAALGLRRGEGRRAGGQGDRRREIRRRDKGPHGEGAEDTPNKGRRDNDGVRQGAPRRLRPLRGARRRHREVARGDEAVTGGAPRGRYVQTLRIGRPCAGCFGSSYSADNGAENTLKIGR